MTAWQSSATTRTVTNLNDAGPGSLRDTIAASVGGDTVNFSAGLTGTITLALGELTIARDLTIIGPGSAILTIQAGGQSRIFTISSANASLSGLTLRNGFVTTVGGGGILNSAALTLKDCVLDSNRAASTLPGGAIYNTGALTVSNCNFSGNYAFQGGGIYSSGSVTLMDCTLSQNQAIGGNSVDTSGGGIFNAAGVLLMSNSTVSASFSLANGSGIYNLGSMTAVNSTLVDNRSDGGYGGGIYSSGAVILNNCTISGNRVVSSGAGLYQSGNSATIRNTIIAGNTTNALGGNPFVSDVAGNITSQGHNFIGKTNSSSGWISSDFTGSIASPLNALLGPLQNNGGATPTLLPSRQSAVIDAGDDTALDPPSSLIKDQRGYPRKLGAHIDIGAVETDPAQTGATFIVTTTDDHNDGVAGAVDCTLREAILAANANADANIITFASNVTGVITLRLGELQITYDLTILGPGATILAVNANRGGRVFNVLAGTVFISDLAITNGRMTGAVGAVGATPGGTGRSGGSAFGGGIFNQATLTLSNCWVAGNSVLGGMGGAGGPDDSRNQAGTGGAGGPAMGAGIYSIGSLTLKNCAVTENIAIAGAGGIGPDGMNYFYGDAGSGGPGGSATGSGVANAAGSFNLMNSTIGGNIAVAGNGGRGGNGGPGGNGGNGGSGGDANGGGVGNLSDLVLASCTISANSVTNGSEGLAGLGSQGGADGANGSPGRGQGGGVYSTTTLNSLQNTLVAGNNAGTGPDCSGSFTSQGFNLIGKSDGATGFTSGSDQTGTAIGPLDPILGALRSNGGATPSFALLPGSSAIDKGYRAGLLTDQRGKVRPNDFPSVSNAPGGDGSDIGAFELTQPVLSIARSANAVVVSWPTADAGYTLQSNTNLNSSLTWTQVPGTGAAGNRFAVTNATIGNKFYRLKY